MWFLRVLRKFDNFITFFLLLLYFYNSFLTLCSRVCSMCLLIFGEEFFQLLEFYTKSCGGTGINIIIVMVVIQDY